MSRTVLLVGRFAPGALELGYEQAFRSIDWSVERFDFEAALRRNCRFGGAGYQLNRFIPVEPWIHKVNRELVLEVERLKPELVVIFGQTLVRPGALAQIRVGHSGRTVLLWPDSLTHLSHQTVTALPLYDLVASYSRSAIDQFSKLGGAKVEWIPLGADPTQHPRIDGDVGDRFKCDVSFVGQWRPEREAALADLVADRPSLDVKIWGPDWGRRVRGNARIRAAWQGRSLFRDELAMAVRAARVNLNVIDPTNFPAANMRFFEIPAMGGLQLASACPELEDEFRDGESVFYYADRAGLSAAVGRILDDPGLRERVREAGHRRVLDGHLYAHRAAEIVRLVGL